MLVVGCAVLTTGAMIMQVFVKKKSPTPKSSKIQMLFCLKVLADYTQCYHTNSITICVLKWMVQWLRIYSLDVTVTSCLSVLHEICNSGNWLLNHGCLLGLSTLSSVDFLLDSLCHSGSWFLKLGYLLACSSIMSVESLPSEKRVGVVWPGIRISDALSELKTLVNASFLLSWWCLSSLLLQGWLVSVFFVVDLHFVFVVRLWAPAHFVLAPGDWHFIPANDP